MTLGAPFAVAWAKLFRPQIVVCVGGLLFGLASVLASFGEKLWHFYLTQGLLLGVGTCMTFMPSMALSPTWFDKRRGLAMGFISAGTGFGGLVWAPAISAGIDHIGFRNTLRLTGAISAFLLCASGAALDWEPSMAAQLRAENVGRSARQAIFRIPLPRKEILMQRKFIAQALGAAFQSGAYYTPVFFIGSYAKTLGYSASIGATFIAVSNACNAIGKITVGFVADRIGRLNSIVLVTLLSALATWAFWIPSTLVGSDNESLGRGFFIAFAVSYGLFASAYVSLFPPTLVELFGLQEMPRVTGPMFFVQGAAAMIGTPVAGVLLRHGKTKIKSEDFLGMSILVGVLLTATTVMVTWVRYKAMLAQTRGGRGQRWKL